MWLLWPGPALNSGLVLFAVDCQANCCFNVSRALKPLNLVYLFDAVESSVHRGCVRRVRAGPWMLVE